MDRWMNPNGRAHATEGRLLERGFGVLLELARRPDGARLAELSRACTLSKATTLRILRTLMKVEAVTVDPATRVYGLGTAIGRLSAAAARARDVVRIATPVLDRLRDDTGETVCLFRRQGDERVAIAVAPSPQDLRLSIDVGQQRPLTRGAPGRVLMAHLTDRELEEIVLKLRPEARRALIAACRAERRAGFAISEGEVVVGGTAVAAPVIVADGEVFALAVFGPSARLARPAIARLVRLVRRAASEIATRMSLSRHGKESDR